MASLEDLITQSLSGIISGGGLPLEEDLYQRQALAEREGTFGRGLGISSVTRDALAKARVDAALAAQSAQLSALGQAAGVTQANSNRAQQGSQFNAALNQRNKALNQQESQANKAMLASGLAAGGGAALQLGGLAFAPEIRSNLRGLFGLGANPSPISPAGGREVMAPPSAVPDLIGGGGGGALDLASLGSIPDLTSGGFGDYGGYSLSGLDLGGGSDLGGYDLGDYSLDLSGLFDFSPTTFTPYDWSSAIYG